MLQLTAAVGEINLKYLDESEFCMWGIPGYTYYPVGEQKRLEKKPSDVAEDLAFST